MRRALLIGCSVVGAFTLAGAAFGAWLAWLYWSLHHPSPAVLAAYRASPLAAQEEAGRWHLLLVTPGKQELDRWQGGRLSPVAMRDRVHPPTTFAFDATSLDGRLGRLRHLPDNRKAAEIVDMRTAGVLAAYETEEPSPLLTLSCPILDEDGSLLFLRTWSDTARNFGRLRSMVRLSPGGRVSDVFGLEGELGCPTFSGDRRRVLWTEPVYYDESGNRSARPAFRLHLAERREGRLVETKRWMTAGPGSLAPDGASIVVFENTALARIAIEGGGTARLAAAPAPLLPQEPRVATPEHYFPQVFSPDGRWVLIEQTHWDPCRRKLFAFCVADGRTVELPIRLPPFQGYCGSYLGTSDPYRVRWVREGGPR